MNNGNFPNGSGREQQEYSYRLRERKPILPFFVLFLGIFGFFNPMMAVAAFVLGFVCRHTMGKWVTTAKLGTIFGGITVGLLVLGILLIVILTLADPHLGEQLSDGLKIVASSANMLPMYY